MKVNNAICFISSIDTLIDPLRIKGHCFRRIAEPGEKDFQILLFYISNVRKVGEVLRSTRSCLECSIDILRALLNKVFIECVLLMKISQESIEKSGITTWLYRQVKVGNVTGCRFTRVDHNNLHIRASFLRRSHALEQDRVGPGGIASSDDQ